MSYLVIKNHKDNGCYYFSSDRKMKELMQYYSDCKVFKDSEMEQAFEFAGVSKFQDGRIIIEKNQKKEKTEKTVVEVKKENPYEIIFKQFLSNNKRFVQVTLVNGEEYIITLDDAFFTSSINTLKDVLKNNFSLNSSLSASFNDDYYKKELVKTHKVFVLKKTTIKYLDDFIILTGCDDKYSPDIVEENGVVVGFKHNTEKLYINKNSIASIKAVKGFDIDVDEIRSEVFRDFFKTIF